MLIQNLIPVLQNMHPCGRAKYTIDLRTESSAVLRPHNVISDNMEPHERRSFGQKAGEHYGHHVGVPKTI